MELFLCTLVVVVLYLWMNQFTYVSDSHSKTYEISSLLNRGPLWVYSLNYINANKSICNPIAYVLDSNLDFIRKYIIQVSNTFLSCVFFWKKTCCKIVLLILKEKRLL